MKIIIGAAGKQYDGWISTEETELDITKQDDFYRITHGELESVDAFLLEDVIEHIEYSKIRRAFCNLNDYLKRGGYVRISTPDGCHPDPEYIAHVSPPSMGHKRLYDSIELMYLLSGCGFNKINVHEYWTVASGAGSFDPPLYEFHMRYLWPNDEEHGLITRAFATDERNADGKPHYTSLIVDAWKL